MTTRPRRFRIIDIRPLVIIGVGLYATYLAAGYIASGNEDRLYLLGAILLGGLVLYNPRLGLYAFCFTLILAPTGLRIEGIKGTSPSAMMIVLSVVALAVSIVTRRVEFRFSNIYVPAGLAMLVVGSNLFLRYGLVFWNVGLILSESLLVFALSFHLIKTPVQVRQILIVVLLAVTLRTVLDVVLTVISLKGGAGVGTIRSEEAWLGASSTAESHFRGMLLPLFIAAVVLSRDKTISMMALVALLASVAWLSLAFTRQGFMGLAMAPVVTMMFLPGAQRRQVLMLALVGLPVVIIFSVYFSDAWVAVLESNRIDLEGGFEAGRPALWLGAARAFWENPWIGSSYGPSHSYLLGSARSMGLVYLVPFIVALWLVWRHGTWLRKQPLDPVSQVMVVGVQSSLLIAVVFNSVGQMFQGASSAFYFWMLVGVQEAIYRSVLSGHYPLLRPGPEEVQGQPRGNQPASSLDEGSTPLDKARTLP